MPKSDSSDLSAPPETDFARLVAVLDRLSRTVEAWEEPSRGTVHAYRDAIEALHGEALRRLVRVLRADPAGLAALKSAAADEIVYAVLRRHDIIKPSLNERIEAALDGIRPMLSGHGGDVELVRLAPPTVEVLLTGACDTCPASALTFHAGIMTAVQTACPEITEVIQVKRAQAGRAATAAIS